MLKNCTLAGGGCIPNIPNGESAPGRDVGNSRDPLETMTWRPKHLMLILNDIRSLVVYHLFCYFCLCLVLKGLLGRDSVKTAEL